MPPVGGGGGGGYKGSGSMFITTLPPRRLKGVNCRASGHVSNTVLECYSHRFNTDGQRTGITAAQQSSVQGLHDLDLAHIHHQHSFLATLSMPTHMSELFVSSRCTCTCSPTSSQDTANTLSPSILAACICGSNNHETTSGCVLPEHQSMPAMSTVTVLPSLSEPLGFIRT